MAQCFVIDLLPIGPQLPNDLPDLNHVPGDNGVVQNRQATECMHLIAEFTAPQHALLQHGFLAKTQKSGEVVGCLALVQLFARPAGHSCEKERPLEREGAGPPSPASAPQALNPGGTAEAEPSHTTTRSRH